MSIEEIMLEQIKPWIVLNDNTKIQLRLSKKEKDAYCYEDDRGRACLTLSVKESGGVGAVLVDAKVKPAEYQYGELNYLNPECAVVLEIQSPDHIKRYMADYLYSEFWCQPYFGTDLAKVPKDTQALLWEKNDGTFGFLLPVCGEKYKCTVNGSENGLNIMLFSWYSGLNECKSLAFLFAEGENPFEMSEACVEYGFKLLGGGFKARKDRRYPEIFEYLGWCSWDALQIRVGTDGLLKKCEEFKQKNIPVRWVIIDDMWAEVKGLNEVPEDIEFEKMGEIMHRSRLYSFEADPVRFPGGLEECIDKIKEGYGLKVGMWHPTTGYWRGIDPEGPIAREHKDLLVETGDGRRVPSPQLEKAFLFYNAFHTFLKQSGADFLKIDNQSFIRGFLKGKLPVGQAARNVHRAIESSVGSHFDNQLINCMGMALESMWNRPVSAISRCSDDFLPENRAWFIKHILQCSYNSFVQGNFLWCDWDMWWTDDGQAVKNSVLRAISGGPVYLSDKIGRSVREVIMPLVLEDGRILRCDRPAVPTKDCLAVDSENAGTPFKVWNRCGDNGIIAAFNLNRDNRAVAGSLSVSDAEGMEGDRFIVFEHFSKAVYSLGREEKLELALKNQDDFRLFIVVPVKAGLAAVGLINKYISPKAMACVNSANIELLEGGVFAFVSEKEVECVMANGQRLSPERRDNLYTVDCSGISGKISMQVVQQ